MRGVYDPHLRQRDQHRRYIAASREWLRAGELLETDHPSLGARECAQSRSRTHRYDPEL